MADCPPNKLLAIVGFLSIVWGYPALLPAAEINLKELGKAHQADLLSISSDKEAVLFFKKKLSPKLQLTPKQNYHKRRSPLKQNAQKLQNEIISMVANLVASRLAATIQSQSQQGNQEILHRQDVQQEPARAWLPSKTLSLSTTKMLSFMTSYSDYFQDFSFPQKRPLQFDAFAHYVDQRYPKLIGSENSWLGLLEQGKVSEISKRFSEYWEQHQSVDPIAGQDSTDVGQYAHFYSGTRLFPIFKTHLIALTIQAEAEAMHLAQESLSNIKNQLKSQARLKDTSRLCGTWHWIVHNHQNHGDHKMTVFFGDPTQHSTNQPQPTEITINGNTVYLLWKFPRGYQEDSLLLSNNDKRLEGTFRNTLGPYGSITGKRISSCKP